MDSPPVIHVQMPGHSAAWRTSAACGATQTSIGEILAVIA